MQQVQALVDRGALQAISSDLWLCSGEVAQLGPGVIVVQGLKAMLGKGVEAGVLEKAWVREGLRKLAECQRGRVQAAEKEVLCMLGKRSK